MHGKAAQGVAVQWRLPYANLPVHGHSSTGKRQSRVVAAVVCKPHPLQYTAITATTPVPPLLAVELDWGGGSCVPAG